MKYIGYNQKFKIGNYVLTRRQIQICNFIHSGLSNASIANRLSLREKTVKFHLTRIYKITGKSSRLKLAKMMCDLNRTAPQSGHEGE